jgi:hypothetical protein
VSGRTEVGAGLVNYSVYAPDPFTDPSSLPSRMWRDRITRSDLQFLVRSRKTCIRRPTTSTCSCTDKSFWPPGPRAYFGLLDIGQPKPGETVFVSGAAGAVGSLVGQIAKIKGCHVVGSAGSHAKVDHLLTDLGFDAAFDYKQVTDYAAKLQDICPQGIEVYFDNVGGSLTDAVFTRINIRARIVVCGQIDQWLGAGQAQYRETVVDGLENAPDAFIGLFRGENMGKQLVRVAQARASLCSFRSSLANVSWPHWTPEKTPVPFSRTLLGRWVFRTVDIVFVAARRGSRSSCASACWLPRRNWFRSA